MLGSDLDPIPAQESEPLQPHARHADEGGAAAVGSANERPVSLIDWLSRNSIDHCVSHSDDHLRI